MTKNLEAVRRAANVERNLECEDCTLCTSPVNTDRDLHFVSAADYLQAKNGEVDGLAASRGVMLGLALSSVLTPIVIYTLWVIGREIGRAILGN